MALIASSIVMAWALAGRYQLVPFEKSTELTAAWSGKPVAPLLVKLGKPDEVTPLAETVRYNWRVHWKSSRTRIGGPNGSNYPALDEDSRCTLGITTRDDLIEKIYVDGHQDRCAKYLRILEKR